MVISEPIDSNNWLINCTSDTSTDYLLTVMEVVGGLYCCTLALIDQDESREEMLCCREEVWRSMLHLDSPSGFVERIVSDDELLYSSSLRGYGSFEDKPVIRSVGVTVH